MTIRFDRPTATLPVSLTGRWCALRCAHCNGRYLEHMRPIWDADVSAAESLLISGGCDLHGRVPLDGHLDAITRLRHGRRLNWHLGFVDEPDLLRVRHLIDVVSFDVVGDKATAREVYGLEADLADYMATLDMLRTHVPVVPHVTIGLRGGRLSGEWAALQALAERELESLIFIVLIPTPGTAYAECDPPALEDVEAVLTGARVLMPETHLALGCMRPRGRYRQAMDEIAVQVGMNGIVNPSAVARRAAQELGLEIVWGDACCALG